jgi:hypothetical protein
MNLAKTILEEVRSTDYGFYNVEKLKASLADHTKPHPPWNEPADGKI